MKITLIAFFTGQLVTLLTVGIIYYYITANKELKPEEFVSKSGVTCVYLKSNMTCNWDKYNKDTRYGEFPYAIEKEEDFSQFVK